MPDEPNPVKTYTQEQVDAMLAERVAPLDAKNREVLGELKTLKSKATPVLEILGDRTPDQIRADLEFAAKAREDKARAEGNFETLKAQLLEQHKTELEKVTGRTSRVESKLYDVMARREAEAAIRAAGGNPKVLLPHVLPAVKVKEDGEDFIVRIVDAKGNDRIADGQGTPMTIAQLVEVFKADPEFGAAFEAPPAAGGGARNTPGAGGQGGAVVLKGADAKDPQKYRAAKAEAEKRGVPFRVEA